jgi:2-keto-4-pentenoate hydratase/2-oxohepta-3-ene-1,7-dioic acid hydratase in catechol pathway
MKLATLQNGQAIAVVGAHHQAYVALSQLGFIGSLADFILAGSEALANIKARLTDAATTPLDQQQLALPLAQPSKIICVGLNYRDHAIESGMAIPLEPVIFTRFQSTLAGPYANIPAHAHLTQQLDYEVELGVIIGQKTQQVAQAEALDHVFGYTVVNDLSARDLQLGPNTGGQWTRGKNLDQSCPFGPWIVTRDEVADPQNLRLGCRVNGQDLQDSNTSQMVFGVSELIHRLSHWFCLNSGDLIITGTPVGVGFARKPPIFLRPGDTTTAWIEGVGEIHNTIVDTIAAGDGQ